MKMVISRGKASQNEESFVKVYERKTKTVKYVYNFFLRGSVGMRLYSYVLEIEGGELRRRGNCLVHITRRT